MAITFKKLKFKKSTLADSLLGNKSNLDEIKKVRKENGLCVECGSEGEWVQMALVCLEHGRIIG